MDTAPCSINMGRIYPPFVFGVIMLIRFFLLYLISFSAFADCPAGESIGSYPLSTPQVFCANYIGNSCAAVCGWSSGQPAVCVGTATEQGPYRLTGASCEPHDPGGTVDCSLTPLDPSCFITPPDCTANPTDPACSSGGGNTGGSTGGVTDTGSAHCGSGVGCTFNPKGYFTSASESDSGMHQIHDVLNSLTTVTTYSDNLTNTTLSAISDSLNVFSNKYQSNLIDANNATLKTNDYLADIKWRLDNPLSGSTSGSVSTSPDYTSLLNGLGSMVSGINYNTTYANFNLESMRFSLGNLNSINSNMYSVTDTLRDIKTILSNSASSGSGTGSGGGDGSGTGPSVGTAENPAHVASSLYKSCTDCVVDVEGAQSELDVSKEKLKTTIKSIQADFKNIFTFDSGAGSGSSAIASCWDFGDLIGKKCMQVDETWALLKALVLFIFLMAIVFMFTRGN